jgi:hypothetical protein
MIWGNFDVFSCQKKKGHFMTLFFYKSENVSDQEIGEEDNSCGCEDA